jgi:hypothetical protein
MPRLSLYRPEKGNDYKFIDKNIWELFQVGGTDVLIHKYIGPGSISVWEAAKTYKVGEFVQRSISGQATVYKAIVSSTGIVPPNSNYWEFIRTETPTTPVYSSDDPFQIQDLLFLENRDRKYDPDIYVLRGIYNVQDTDFNLSQFGLFLQNDTIFITFHINDTVEKVGRKLISGDVIELPHLKDEYALNDLQFALKRFYVIEEVSRAAEGFSVTWYPHLYRAKCKPLVDSQEFKDILDRVADSDSYQGNWNQDITYYPGDVVTGPDGKNYTCIDPIPETWSSAETFYPGDIVLGPDGVKYIVVDNSVPTWNGDTEYQPGDTVTGPDGKIYQVLDNANTVDGFSGILPPDSDYYQAIPGTGITGSVPSESDRYQPIDIVANGVTNVFPPNTTYWQISDTLRDISSTYEKEMQITQAILDQAEADAPKSGYDTTKFYTVQRDADGRVELITSDTTELDASLQTQATDENGNPLVDEQGNPVYVGNTAATVFRNPEYSDYDGYLVGDGIPPNGAAFTAGIAFPLQPVDGQYHLRTDYLPKRLFRFNGSRWVKMEDNVRMTMSNLGASDTGPGDRFEGKDVRLTQKTSFINNDNQSRIDGKNVKEKQSLSKALRPQADE